MIINKSEKLSPLISLTLFLFIVAGIYYMSVHPRTTSTTVFACVSETDCQAEVDAAKAERAKLQQEQAALEQKSADTRAQIENIIKQINSYTAEIELLNGNIEALNRETVRLEQSMAETDALLRSRLETTQLSFETNETLNFIANANSITDMIERTQMIDDFTQSDKQKIDLYDAQNKAVIKNRQELEVKKTEVEAVKQEQEELKNSRQAELEKYMEEYANAQNQIQIALTDEQISAEKLEEFRKAREALENATSGGTILEGDAAANAKVAMQFFTAAGYTKEGAAGIIGNYYVESFMNPAIVQGNGAGPGRGLAQWEDATMSGNASGRWQRLLSYATLNGRNPVSLQAQLEFTVYEMQHYYPSVDSFLRSTTSISEATNIVLVRYEAPACPSCTLQQRINYAQQAYNSY